MEAVLPKTSTAGPYVSDTTHAQDFKHVQTPRTTALDGNHNARSRDISVLRHKIDRHIVPIMFLCYLMNFIDKVALNVRTGAFSLQHLTVLMSVIVCSGHGPQQGPEAPSERFLERSDCVLRCISDRRDTHW